MEIGRQNARPAVGEPVAAAGAAPFRVVPEKTVVPDRPADVLDRRELVNRVDPVQRRLTVLVGAGGFGKTVLLGECCRLAEARGDKVIWLSADEEDDARRVVAHLAYAIDVPWNVQDSHVGRLQPTEMYYFEALLDAMRATERHWVLVVDELDRMDRDGGRIIDQLIWRGPANLHVALACRELPNYVDVATSVAEGRGVVVQGDELRFTRAEFGSFFGGTLSPDQLAVLWAECQGWPIAACLQRNSAAIEVGQMPELSINWVGARLMRGMADEDRRFLSEAGCFEWTDAQMFDEVLGPGSTYRLQHMPMLRGLVQELDGGASFRLHPLIRRHASNEMRLRGEDADLRSRIARSLARRGRTVDAMRQAIKAVDGDLAGEILEAAGAVRMILRTGVQGLKEAVTLLSDDVLERFPRLQLARAAVDVINNAIPGLMSGMQRAAPVAGDDARGGPVDDELHIDWLFVRGLTLMCGCTPLDSPDVQSVMAESFRVIAEDKLDALAFAGFIYGHAVTAYALGDLAGALSATRRVGELSYVCPSAVLSARMLEGAILFVQGESQKSEAALTAAQRTAQRDFPGHESPEMICDAFVAEIALETNRLALASRRAPALDKLASVGAWLDVYAAAVDVRTELAFRQNAPDRALRILEDAWSFARGRGLATFARWLVAVRVSALIKVGEADRAERLWRREGLPEDTETQVEIGRQSWREMEAICGARARLLLAKGEHDAALELARAFAGRARNSRLARCETWATALAMHAAWLAGDLVTARKLLVESLRLLDRTGFSRAFAAHAEATVAVLEGFDTLPGDLNSAKETALEVVATVGGVHVEPDLTERQIEILARLSHASDKEIARELGISDNGVRYHIKKIYGELGVANRAEAVAKSRRLGLLPPPPPNSTGRIGSTSASAAPEYGRRPRAIPTVSPNATWVSTSGLFKNASVPPLDCIDMALARGDEARAGYSGLAGFGKGLGSADEPTLVGSTGSTHDPGHGVDQFRLVPGGGDPLRGRRQPVPVVGVAQQRRDPFARGVAEPPRGDAAQQRPLPRQPLGHAFAASLGHAFPASFRDAFPAPLLGPLRNPFDQRHRRLLQGLAQFLCVPVRADPGGDLPHPRRERAAEIRVRLRPQPAPQGLRHPRHVDRRPALLEADHRPHQVAERQIVHRGAALVKQQRALRRLARRQRRRNRRHQVAHLQLARPRRVAVVEHHRQHRRPPAGRAQFAAAVQLPVQQRRVLQVLPPGQAEMSEYGSGTAAVPLDRSGAAVRR